MCEFRCSDYAGYTCQNSSTLLPSLSVCKSVLENDMSGQHCAPSELSILQQLEEVVVMPNYHRLFPGGPRKFLNYIRGRDCDGAAKRLACWVSSFTIYICFYKVDKAVGFCSIEPSNFWFCAFSLRVHFFAILLALMINDYYYNFSRLLIIVNSFPTLILSSILSRGHRLLVQKTLNEKCSFCFL